MFTLSVHKYPSILCYQWELLKKNTRSFRNQSISLSAMNSANGKNHLFIFLMLVCRFSFYGMKAILPLFLTGTQGFSQNRSTTLIHSFNFSAYFFTLFGGIISDSLLGRYMTILVLSLVYCAGMAVLAAASFPFIASSAWFLAGLTLVALGTGGIKPCVSAFGGDQFDPSQVDSISTYFSIFYFAINAGSVLSMFITPIIRQNVHW